MEGERRGFLNFFKTPAVKKIFLKLKNINSNGINEFFLPFPANLKSLSRNSFRKLFRF